MTESACAEALRIVRSIEACFASGRPATGSAFVAAPNRLITCAHVVRNDSGQTANRVIVKTREGTQYDATVGPLDRSHDLAVLEAQAEIAPAPSIERTSPPIGRSLVFAGQPRGVRRPAIFPAVVSDIGDSLIRSPRGKLIQLAGMINNGNSGGPVLDSTNGGVVGVITAKYVPLLAEIDKLTQALRGIPQIPSSVGLGEVDFAKFVNLTIQSLFQVGAVLRLVQVGTGWAVPSEFFSTVGV